MGPVSAQRIITYAQKVLWPDPELAAIRQQILAADLQTLDLISARIEDYSEQLQQLVVQTPYQVLCPVKGLTPVRVASLAAAIGDPHYYAHAGQIFRRSGLVSGRHDSGAHQRQGRGKPITKSGDVFLRRALNDALNGLLVHQPVLGAYYNRLKLTKPTGVARVATMRRATGILWATVRDQRADTLVCQGDIMT